MLICHGVVAAVCCGDDFVAWILRFSRAWWRRLNAALLAGAICFGSASAALVVTAMTAGSPNALAGSFLGIFLRTALPFFVSILLVQASKPLADAGLFGMVLISYLVVLAVETVLAVRIVQAHSIDGGSAVNG